MIQLGMTGILTLSMLVVAQQNAQKPASQEPDQAERANKLGQQDDKIDNSQPNAEQSPRTELPDVFKELDLTDQQKQQLLSIYRDSDQKSQEIWDRVQGLHRQAISMEAAAIAAARLEGHDHSAHGSKDKESSKTGTNGKVNPVDAGKDTGAALDGDDARQKSSEASAATESSDGQRAEKDNEERSANTKKANRREKRALAEAKPSLKEMASAVLGGEGDLDVVAIRIGIAQPNGRVREYLLTPPNSQAETDSNPSFTAHTSQLTQVWKTIHDGHEELVELEADTIVKVEAQLTEAQLQKLDTTQSQAANTSTNPVDDSRR